MWRETGVSGGARARARTTPSGRLARRAAAGGRIAGATANSGIDERLCSPWLAGNFAVCAFAGQQQSVAQRLFPLQQSWPAAFTIVQACAPRAQRPVLVTASRMARSRVASRRDMLGVWPSISGQSTAGCLSLR